MLKYTFTILCLSILFSCNQNQKGENQKSEEDVTVNTNVAFSDQFIDGQPINIYLKMPELPEIVKEYYTNQLVIKPEPKIDSLIQILITPDKNLTPFYFKCFMNICEKADTSIYTYLGGYCIRLLEDNTYYCVNKLKKGYPDYFTGLIANEIYQKENWEEEINNMSVMLHVNLEKEAPALRKELDLLIVGIKNDIEHLIEQ